MKKFLNISVVLISLATVASGLTQLIMPEFVLKVVGGSSTPTSAHFFAIVGMFMFLFGGMMLHAVYNPVSSRVVILCSAFQKLGAFAAVGLGVIHGLFSYIALGVAFFDLFSGILFLVYWKSIKQPIAH